MLKKILLPLLLLIAVSANAQKGMMGVGIEVSPGYDLSTEKFIYGIGANFQYNVSDCYQIKPFISFSKNDKIETQIGLDNLIFPLPEAKIKPFIGLGLAYGNMNVKVDLRVYDGNYYDYYGIYPKYNTLVTRLSLGVSMRLSHKLSMQVSASGHYLPINYHATDTQGYNFYSFSTRLRLLLNVGLAYNF